MGERWAEWRHGWRTLLSASLGYPIAGFGANTLGIIMAPLQAESGWSRTTISASLMILSISVLALAPVAGKLISSHGPRKIALASIVTTAIGFVVIASAGGSSWTWIGAWVVYGILSCAVGPMLWTTGVTQMFSRSRGLALALAMSGNGVAMVFLPLLAVFVTESLGWRWLYFCFAAALIVFYLPFTWSLFVRRTDANAAAASVSASGNARAESFATALRSPGFWLLALFAVLLGGVEGAFLVHLFPILTEGGLAPEPAAAAVSLVGVALIVGRLTSGMLMDRISPTIVASGEAAMVLIASLLAQTMLGPAGIALLIAIVLGFGCGGTASAIAILVSRHFDVKLYAPVFGVIYGAFSLTYGIGPVLASRTRDVLGSYEPIFVVFTPLLLGAIVLVLLFELFHRRWTPRLATLSLDP